MGSAAAQSRVGSRAGGVQAGEAAAPGTGRAVGRGPVFLSLTRV